jgi:8-oxo-dGTP pyrophosphatase MutT (NUDIX family)
MSKIFTATDINQNKFSANESDFSFRISSYGVLIEDGKILLQKSPLSHFYNLPGGGVEVGESEKDAVVREFNEETGYQVVYKKHLDFGFNLFTFENNFFHNFFVFSEVERISLEVGNITDPEDSSEAKFFDLKSLDINIVNPIHRSIIEKYL